MGAPGAILIGPLLAAIGFGLAGVDARVPRPVFVAAQGVIGCVIAGAVSVEVLKDIAAEWDWMLLGVGATLVASTLVGLLVARFGSLPGTTAAWGSSPGAASAMVAMAEEFGADTRLVALMQYLRVICVVLTASAVAHALGARPSGAAATNGAAATSGGAIAAGGPTALSTAAMLATLLVAVLGSWAGRRLRVPAGGLLVPLLTGSLLNGSGLVRLDLPAPLLVAAYAAVGWYVGLQFEQAVLRRSLRALPEILLAAFATIALSAVAAALMSRYGGRDLLTTILATSPGGIDSVAILALDGGADAPFVLALQTLRVLVVIAVGPSIARLVARAARVRRA